MRRHKWDRIHPNLSLILDFFVQYLHRARECSKKEKLTTLIAFDRPIKEPKVTNPQLSPIQLLNALWSEDLSCHKGLMYVDVVLNGHPIKVMLDKKATNNFVIEKMVSGLGIKGCKEL